MYGILKLITCFCYDNRYSVVAFCTSITITSCRFKKFYYFFKLSSQYFQNDCTSFATIILCELLFDACNLIFGTHAWVFCTSNQYKTEKGLYQPKL